ncbi:MAG: ribosomal L7Ae/L30e/S12e/Gadd45 family protein [Bacillota bacterium]|nr:ribosomal L7Ae/L30e/S12e/Gadd45 family protein [Bacillota bacterium]
MNITKILGLLGIAKKAGFVSAGAEKAHDTARQGRARLVIMSEGASTNTKKRIENFCHYYEVELITLPVTAEELGCAVGLCTIAVIALTDKGIAQSIVKNTGVGL